MWQETFIAGQLTALTLKWRSRNQQKRNCL